MHSSPAQLALHMWNAWTRNLEARGLANLLTSAAHTVRIAEGRNPLEMRASDCMTQPCVTVSDKASIMDCIHLIEEHQVRRIPVTDERGRCCGIVSQADVARKIDEHAAEILKEVSQPAEAHRRTH